MDFHGKFIPGVQIGEEKGPSPHLEKGPNMKTRYMLDLLSKWGGMDVSIHTLAVLIRRPSPVELQLGENIIFYHCYNCNMPCPNIQSFTLFHFPGVDHQPCIFKLVAAGGKGQ